MSLQPSAPAAPVNEFYQLLGISGSTSYMPNQRQFFYTMHLRVKRRWLAGYESVKSQQFVRLASEVIPEIQLTMDLGTAVCFSLVHVGRYKLSNKIKLVFGIESVVGFDAKEICKLFKRMIKKNGKIGDNLVASVDGLKVEKCQFVEYDHLKKHGANPCPLCEKLLRDHRGINVNNRNNLVDMLAFTNVLTGIGLAVCSVALLI